MKRIVEYDSKMNELNFGKFKEKELDLFFSICYKMKNQGTNEISLSFQELKELSNYSNRNLDRFTKDLQNTYKKLLNITMQIENENYIEGFTIFTSYKIKKEEREISIKVNEDYRFILNDITKFTKFDLMDFISLKSSYSKNMFKLLKQFDKANNNNWYIIKIDEFKKMLNIPESYKMGSIDQKVLSPILDQLEPYFSDLKLEKIKKGVKVESLKFIWKNKKEKKIIVPIKKKKSLGEEELLEYENSIQKFEVENIIFKNNVEKIKISFEQYEQLYLAYLEQIGEKHNVFIRKSFDINNKDKYDIS
ncbi:MAG: replication initiation protein [Cetobacterium sp.]